MRAPPLARFLALGAVLFAAMRVLAPEPGADADARRIVVPQSIAASGSADTWIEEEILVRAALERGLDHDPVVVRRLERNLAFADAEALPRRSRDRLRDELLCSDPVVRRRLAERIRAALETDIDAAPPDEAELRAWLDRHGDRFAFPGAVAFEQVFFDPARRRDAGTDAQRALASLAAGSAAAGDPPPIPAGGVHTPAGIARYLGDDFAAALLRLPPGIWSGPLASPLGLHLVRVVRLDPPRPATLAEARARATAAILDERRAAALRAGLERLRRGFTIVGAPGEADPP